MDNREFISDEIKDLLVSYSTGEIDQEKLLILKHWIAISQENKTFFEKFESTWALSNKTNEQKHFNQELAWAALAYKMNDLNENPVKEVKTKKIGLTFMRMAASWLLFFTLGALITLWLTGHQNPIQNQITEITSPMGAKSFVKLPDGSKVWLNAGSKLQYKQDFNQIDRQVSLTGEAFFSVSTNKAKPFTVHTSDIVVRAFGTRFNVKAYPDEKTITTTLEEGKIDVMLVNDNKNASPIKLSPNQKVVFYKQNNSISQLNTTNTGTQKKEDEKITVIQPKPINIELASNVNTELYTSWKESRWIIEGITFESLVPMLERRFNMKIIFKDEELKHYKFSGTIQNETIEQLMDALRFTAPLDYTIVRDSITLTINAQLKSRYQHIITSKDKN